MSFLFLEHPISVLELPFLPCPILFRRTGQDRLKILYRFVQRPVSFFDRLSQPVPSLGKIFSLSHCPFVSWQWRNFSPFVQKSWIVQSRWKLWSRQQKLKAYCPNHTVALIMVELASWDRTCCEIFSQLMPCHSTK